MMEAHSDIKEYFNEAYNREAHGSALVALVTTLKAKWETTLVTAQVSISGSIRGCYESLSTYIFSILCFYRKEAPASMRQDEKQL